jgi:hypothetical protein
VQLIFDLELHLGACGDYVVPATAKPKT